MSMITFEAGRHIFQFSKTRFITLVRERPLLWDRSNRLFHCRKQRAKAWNEIARQVYASFDQIDSNDQRHIVEALIKRWKNTRDSYLRKTQFGKKGEDDGDSRLSFVMPRAYYQNKGRRQRGRDDSPSPPPTVKMSPSKKTSGAWDSPHMSPVVVLKRIRLEPRPATVQCESTRNEDAERDGLKCKIEGNDVPQVQVKQENVTEERPIADGNSSVEPEPESEHAVCQNVQPSPSVSPFVNVEDQTVGDSSTPERTRLPSSSIVDTDQAFFDSIKPFVSELRTKQKLEFRIEVLKVLRELQSP